MSRESAIRLHSRRYRTLAVTGGKGGVGKSSIAVNLAMAYAQMGARPIIMDADMGMADLNLLLGVAPAKSLVDVVHGCPVEKVLVPAHGIHLLPALNGNDCLEAMTETTRQQIFAAIESMVPRFDTLLIDIAAGIGTNQTLFAGAAADTVVVVTADALSLADAYASLKILSLRQGLRHAFIVPNRVRSASEAEELVMRLSSLVAQFLDISLTALPWIPYDPGVSQAAGAGIPLLSYCPDSPASRAIREVARRIDIHSRSHERVGAAKLFWRSMLEVQWSLGSQNVDCHQKGTKP